MQEQTFLVQMGNDCYLITVDDVLIFHLIPVRDLLDAGFNLFLVNTKNPATMFPIINIGDTQVFDFKDPIPVQLGKELSLDELKHMLQSLETA